MAYKVLEEKPGALSELWRKLQPYQNIIFFVFLIIILGILLLIWRGYRSRQLNEQARQTLNMVTSSQVPPDALKDLAQRYQTTGVYPQLKLCYANALAAVGRIGDAQKEYEDFLKKYPTHPLCADVADALKRIEVNQQWTASELARKKTELAEQRNLTRALIKTTSGDFEMELYEDEAPNTVANFISLAEEGYFTQTNLYVSKPELGISLGPKGITFTPTFTIPFETNDLMNEEGMVGMIRDLDPETKAAASASGGREGKEGKPERAEFLNSAAAQFYINLQNSPDNNGKYTIFGRVVKGMDVVQKMKENIGMITSVTISKKRNHSYTPTRLPRKPTPPPTPPPAPPKPPTPPPTPPVPPTPPGPEKR